MPRTFRSAILDHVRLLKKRELAECVREAAKNKADEDAIAKRRAPFQSAAATMEALMKADRDFKKFLKERVATIKYHSRETYRQIASMIFGGHSVSDGWIDEQIKIEWYLIIGVSEKGKVEFKIYNSNSGDPPRPSDPADVPHKVSTAFRPVLKILQDRKKVYDFLIKKFGV